MISRNVTSIYEPCFISIYKSHNAHMRSKICSCFDYKFQNNKIIKNIQKMYKSSNQGSLSNFVSSATCLLFISKCCKKGTFRKYIITRNYYTSVYLRDDMNAKTRALNVPIASVAQNVQYMDRSCGRERSSAPPTPTSQPVLFLPSSRGYRCLPEGIPAGILHR